MSNINNINNQLDKFNFLNNYTNSRNKNLSTLDKSNSNSNKIYGSFSKEYNNNNNNNNIKYKNKSKKPIKLILKDNNNYGFYSPTYKKMEKGVMDVVLYNTTRQIQISRISLSQNIYSSKFMNLSENYDDEIKKKDEFKNILRKKSCNKICKKKTRESYLIRTKTNGLIKLKKDIFPNFNPKIKKKNSLNLVSFDSLL